MQDEHWLRQAIGLGRRGMRAGDGGPFGCVVVQDGRLVAEGWNRVLATPDPTAHAEVEAIRAAARSLGSFELAGCTLYASCEPCPMCLAATMWARVKRVVFAAGRADAAAIGFDDEVFYRELELEPDRRVLRLEQALADEGASMLREWLQMPGRREY